MAKVLHISALTQGPPPAAPTLPAVVRPRVSLPARVYPAALVPAGLPPSVNTAALLLCNAEAPPVRSVATGDLKRQLFQPLEMVPFLLGHRQTLLEGKDLLAMATAVAEMLQLHFPALTLPEVALALRRGSSGEWKKPDELLLPSLPVIRSWLKSYSEGSRAQALQVLQRAESQQQHRRSLPAVNPEHDYPRQVVELMASVKAAGHLPLLLDVGGVLYAWLKKIGAFAGFGDARRMMIKECLVLVRHRPLDNAHRSFAEQLRKGWPAAHPLARKVLDACQKRLLAGWIRYHNARGTDMLTWLQQLADKAAAAPLPPSPTHEPR